jgi:hypothetical protein
MIEAVESMASIAFMVAVLWCGLDQALGNANLLQQQQIRESTVVK